MSIKESTSKKNYSNKSDNNIKVASATQIRKNNRLSNKILKILEASDAIKATGKKFIKKKK
jgi:hypothetical protein